MDQTEKKASQDQSRRSKSKRVELSPSGIFTFSAGTVTGQSPKIVQRFPTCIHHEIAFGLSATPRIADSIHPELVEARWTSGFHEVLFGRTSKEILNHGEKELAN